MCEQGIESYAQAFQDESTKFYNTIIGEKKYYIQGLYNPIERRCDMGTRKYQTCSSNDRNCNYIYNGDCVFSNEVNPWRFQVYKRSTNQIFHSTNTNYTKFSSFANRNLIVRANGNVEFRGINKTTSIDELIWESNTIQSSPAPPYSLHLNQVNNGCSLELKDNNGQLIPLTFPTVPS